MSDLPAVKPDLLGSGTTDLLNVSLHRQCELPDLDGMRGTAQVNLDGHHDR
jgi:hypothetical protein